MKTDSSRKERRVGHGLPRPQTLQRLGKIALLHAQLDNQLRLIVGDLLGLEKEQALNATDRSGSHSLRERIKKIARRRLGETRELALLQDLLTRFGKASERRNKFLHSVWGTDVDSGGVFLRLDDHTFDRAPSLSELDALADCLLLLLSEAVEARLGATGFLRMALAKKPIPNDDDIE